MFKRIWQSNILRIVGSMLLTFVLVLLVLTGVASVFKYNVVDYNETSDTLLCDLMNSDSITECNVKTFSNPISHQYMCKINNTHKIIIDEYEAVPYEKPAKTFVILIDKWGNETIMDGKTTKDRIQTSTLHAIIFYFKKEIIKCHENKQ